MLDDKIKEALMALMDAIKRADDSGVAGRMAEIEALVANGRDKLDPRLAHFLERRSYAKALALLGGDKALPGGTCGRP